MAANLDVPVHGSDFIFISQKAGRNGFKKYNPFWYARMQALLEPYNALSSGCKRDFVIKEIVDPVRRSNGKFILCDNKEQVEDEKAIVKRIMQTFRNMKFAKKKRYDRARIWLNTCFCNTE